MKPGIEPTSSWLLVEFVPAKPQKELLYFLIQFPQHSGEGMISHFLCALTEALGDGVMLLESYSKTRTQNFHALTATHKRFLPTPTPTKDDLNEGSPIKLSVMMEIFSTLFSSVASATYVY